MVILFGFIAFIAQVGLAEESMTTEDLALQTSLLQVGTFQISGESDKRTAFSSTPMTEDTWGHDEDMEADEEQEHDEEEQQSDAKEHSKDMKDLEVGDAEPEGTSELQLSSERAGQHGAQYPQPNPIVMQSPGSLPTESEMPGALRQAVIQSFAPSPSTPKAPVTGLVSTSSSAEYENTSRAAFSQLSALEAEFKDLREDDSSHVKQLMYTVHLREQLRDQLKHAQEQLEMDNRQLAERTVEIVGTGNQGNSVAGNQGAEPEAQAEGEFEPANATAAAMLLQAAISSRHHREVNGQQIAAEALGRVASLMKDIEALRKRDEEEMKILRKNAESREALRVKIENREEQLQTDAGALLEDLNKIRGLVQQHEPEVQGDQAAEPGADSQEVSKVGSDAQMSASGQQPIAALQERVNMFQQQQPR